MKLIKSIILLLVCTYIFWFFEFEAFALSSISLKDIETQITPESSSEKISKLQNLFFWLWLYNWEIDWVYKSIEKTLIDYQIKSWLISDPLDWWAWYFGKKTINQLIIDYWENFEKLAYEHLQLQKPKLWERIFIITAYYSPIEWQNKYLRWSFEADSKLNGWWKTTASWKWVFSWLLAAPKNYDFWTKIELEWIWVWSVEDRWWAIVNAWDYWHNYDRIDIWMWYWDDWLNRAIKWWKREVKWKILENNIDVSVEFDISPIEKYSDLVIDADNPEIENVVKLQELMTEIWLYNWEKNWNFDSIKDELISFQVENNIIDSINSSEAWFFWEKTITVMRKNYWWWWIFKTPQENVYLTLKKKQELEKIKFLLLEYIEKRSKWNIILENKYKLSLKNNIDKYITKISSKKTQQELLFLKDIL